MSLRFRNNIKEFIMGKIFHINAKQSLTLKAFTLAEVLIVLGIIGIVAEMTIPTLVQNFQEKVATAQLKKVYSTLSQAYTMAVQENGTPDTWGLSAPDNHRPIVDNLKPYLKVIQDCSDGSKGCFPTGGMYKFFSPSKGNNGVYDNLAYPKLKLADGTLLFGSVDSNSNCTNIRGTTQELQSECGTYFVDINGYKNPNQLGKDVFIFYLTKYGIIPTGTASDTVITFGGNCSIWGQGCTAWVIYNENMDYTKCPSDLSWGGQTKCN